MKKTAKILISFFVLLMLVMPVVSFAYKLGDPLVPCNNTPADDGTISNSCDFNAFMALINNVIHFLLFYMAVPIAAIMFFYAGFLMVTSGGSSESKTRAKSIFSNAVIGLVLAAAAWLIVKTILSILDYEDIGRFF
ncbi:MAG: pilin [Patescibacteria group bacterium]